MIEDDFLLHLEKKLTKVVADKYAKNNGKYAALVGGNNTLKVTSSGNKTDPNGLTANNKVVVTSQNIQSLIEAVSKTVDVPVDVHVADSTTLHPQGSGTATDPLAFDSKRAPFATRKVAGIVETSGAFDYRGILELNRGVMAYGSISDNPIFAAVVVGNCTMVLYNGSDSKESGVNLSVTIKNRGDEGGNVWDCGRLTLLGLPVNCVPTRVLRGTEELILLRTTTGLYFVITDGSANTLQWKHYRIDCAEAELIDDKQSFAFKHDGQFYIGRTALTESEQSVQLWRGVLTGNSVTLQQLELSGTNANDVVHKDKCWKWFESFYADSPKGHGVYYVDRNEIVYAKAASEEFDTFYSEISDGVMRVCHKNIIYSKTKDDAHTGFAHVSYTIDLKTLVIAADRCNAPFLLNSKGIDGSIYNQASIMQNAQLPMYVYSGAFQSVGNGLALNDINDMRPTVKVAKDLYTGNEPRISKLLAGCGRYAHAVTLAMVGSSSWAWTTGTPYGIHSVTKGVMAIENLDGSNPVNVDSPSETSAPYDSPFDGYGYGEAITGTSIGSISILNSVMEDGVYKKHGCRLTNDNYSNKSKIDFNYNSRVTTLDDCMSNDIKLEADITKLFPGLRMPTLYYFDHPVVPSVVAGYTLDGNTVQCRVIAVDIDANVGVITSVKEKATVMVAACASDAVDIPIDAPGERAIGGTESSAIYKLADGNYIVHVYSGVYNNGVKEYALDASFFYNPIHGTFTPCTVKQRGLFEAGAWYLDPYLGWGMLTNGDGHDSIYFDHYGDTKEDILEALRTPQRRKRYIMYSSRGYGENMSISAVDAFHLSNYINSRVQPTRKVNGKPLSGDIVITKEDLNIQIPLMRDMDYPVTVLQRQYAKGLCLIDHDINPQIATESECGYSTIGDLTSTGGAFRVDAIPALEDLADKLRNKTPTLTSLDPAITADFEV